MKKYFALLSCALMALTACENNALETESTVMNPVNADPQEVTLTFSPYEQEAMTRAGGEATSIATIATRRRCRPSTRPTPTRTSEPSP